MVTLYAPRYYTRFHCIAGQCTHSCCVGWEIDIDEETYALYQSVPGELGDRLRAGMVTSEDGACFALCQDGRCPMLDTQGLCRIITALGEDYLCDICREHPRFYHEAGGRLECGLGASCEEAARLILEADDYAMIEPIEGAGDDTVLQGFDITPLRARVFSLLADRTRPLSARLHAIGQAFCVPSPLCAKEQKALLSTLEYLYEEHRPLFVNSGSPVAPDGEKALLYERFFAYLVYRHTGTAQDEEEFCLALGLARQLSDLFLAMQEQYGLSPVACAVLISEELEYSEENIATILNCLRTNAFPPT